MTRFISLVKDKFSSFTDTNILLAVVDVLLLSALFFMVYRFIRKRRTFSILIGVLSVALMREIALMLKLSAVYSFLNAFFIPGMLMVAVIFQADIRAVLEKLGVIIIGFFRVLTGKLRPKTGMNEVEAVLKAVMRLSASKTGALIVLENNTGVEDVCQNGTKINALVSHELICNLFFPLAPLHDGAVIISGKHINSAGCFLPNYSDPEVNASFGSRHRAAIGMSRASDAGVIVVSEEDGRISYAFMGELSRGIDEQTLRGILEKYYRVSAKKKKVGNEE